MPVRNDNRYAAHSPATSRHFARPKGRPHPVNPDELSTAQLINALVAAPRPNGNGRDGTAGCTQSDAGIALATPWNHADNQLLRPAVAPIPASSGTLQRFRLSLSGDRQANAALHRIVLLRKRHKDPRTMAYIARRTAEGLSDRDIVRCLKRHVANEIFALLTQNPTVALPIGPRLRQRRQTRGIILTEAAKQLDLPYQRLRRLEIGQRADTDLETAFSAWLGDTTQQPNPAQKVA